MLRKLDFFFKASSQEKEDFLGRKRTKFFSAKYFGAPSSANDFTTDASNFNCVP